MKRHYTDIQPHTQDFLYRRLAAVCPVTKDGRDMEIAIQCDGDTLTASSVAYGHGPVKDKWADPVLSEGKTKVPRS